MDVSLIVPTHNRAELLSECLAAIISHDHFRAEVIVVDDCSADHTEAIVSRWRTHSKNHKVIYLRNERNRGAQFSRNRGIGRATSKFIAFVDSDDLIVPQGVFQIIAKLRLSPSLDFAYGSVALVEHDLAPLKSDLVGAEYDDAEPSDIAGYHWHTMGAIYTRDLIRRVGPWNESLSASQDWEYQARVKLASNRRVFLDSLVGLWRQHSGNRVGTEKFRHGHTMSVAAASVSIYEYARAASKTNDRLRRRLSRKIGLHALQFGAMAAFKEKSQLLAQAASVAPHFSSEWIFLHALRFSPRNLDRILLKATVPSMLR